MTHTDRLIVAGLGIYLILGILVTRAEMRTEYFQTRVAKELEKPEYLAVNLVLGKAIIGILGVMMVFTWPMAIATYTRRGVSWIKNRWNR